MATDKIQSSQNGLALQLQNVPKILGLIKQEWAPNAMLVSFKLETNSNILLAKAAGAIHKYQVDLVVANRLADYSQTAVFVWRNGGSEIVVPHVAGDEEEEVAVEGVSQERVDRQGTAEIEIDLIRRVVELHTAFI
eukprot:c10991_g1_i2.p1 GENE.c10991_g1_i2~~c10991_g1_i2.p1  ORF type:complete len:136 (-),score=38.91 c10991_g1_i2:23-430(-)